MRIKSLFPLLLVFYLFCFSACQKEDIDKTTVFEGVYKAPTPYVKYDNVLVKRVDNKTFSIKYRLDKSAPFFIFPNVTLSNDSVFSIELIAPKEGDGDKFKVKGNGIIFPNRIVISAWAENETDNFDFYNLSFEGYK